MAIAYDHITPEQAALIQHAKIFFVASAAPDLSPGSAGQGPVNVSPKGGVPLHIINDNCVAYLDFRGSGNETARHAQSDGPITLMVMSHDPGDAAIIRLYGRATVTPFADSPHAARLRAGARRPGGTPGDYGVPGLVERQVIEIDVQGTATSCGYGVPVLEYVADRDEAGHGRKYK